MIDFIKMEEYLEARATRKYFIPSPGSSFLFSDEIIEKLAFFSYLYKFEEIKKLFPPSVGVGLIYNAQLQCNKCEKYTFTGITKTKLLEYIEYKRNDNPSKSMIEKAFTCKLCKEIKKEEERSRSEHYSRSLKIDMEKQTEKFIEDYLDPDKSWNEGVKYWEKWNSLTQWNYAVNWKDIENHIIKMDYYDFLKTPYWKGITGKKMKEANYKCQLCNNTGKLATHHRTYDIHGKELQNLKDLIVLCDPCHSKFHDKE